MLIIRVYGDADACEKLAGERVRRSPCCGRSALKTLQIPTRTAGHCAA